MSTLRMAISDILSGRALEISEDYGHKPIIRPSEAAGLRHHPIKLLFVFALLLMYLHSQA